MTTMKELLEANRRCGEASRPPETTVALRSSMLGLVNSGIQDETLQKDEAMPAFALPNPAGKIIHSGDLLAAGPVVFNFYRDGWCSYCNIEMRVLQERLDEIEALGASLVAIAPEAPTRAEATAAKNELTHEVLSDAGNVVARTFGLMFTLSETIREIYQGMGIDIPAYNRDDAFEFPIPATYAVGKDGIVLKAFADPDYSKRLEVDDILTALGGA